MAYETKPLSKNNIAILKRRQMDPNNYLLIRDDWDKLLLLDLRFNKIKIVHKNY